MNVNTITEDVKESAITHWEVMTVAVTHHKNWMKIRETAPVSANY